jgi:hypothetical protein
MIDTKFATKSAILGLSFTLVTLTGCSQSPITESDFRIDNAREQFQQRREQNEPGQPIASKPSEQKKIERAVRVLRVFQGVDESGQSESVKTDSKEALKDQIEQSLGALATTLVAKINTPQTPATVTTPSDPQTNSNGLVPVSILDEGFVYLNANQVIFEESILLNSFTRMQEQGLVSTHPSYFAFSGLPMHVVIEQMASAADVSVIIMIPDQEKNLAVSYEYKGSSVDAIDRFLTEQQLKTVWDAETSNAWIMTNEEYARLVSEATTVAEAKSSRRQSLRSGNEQRELFELAARVQDAQLAMIRSGAQSLPVVLSDIEKTFSKLTPATKQDLIEDVTTLRKTWLLYEQAPETPVVEEIANNVQQPAGNTILDGTASIERTTCLDSGETVKTVKIFTAYKRPEDVHDELDRLKAVWDTRDNTSAAATADQQPPAGESADATEQAQTPSTGTDPCAAIADADIAFDDQGLIVTAPQEKIDLILNLLDGIDTAQKQVLVEVYLVQVNADWRRQIELSLATLTSNTELATAFGGAGATLLNLTRGSTNASAASTAAFKLQGNSSDITNLLTFLEQNDIGQTISSPSILALPGEEDQKFSVKRTRTLKFERTIPAETSFDSDGNLVQTRAASTEWVPKDLELIFEVSDVKVTPANNNVEMLFSFKEDTIDSETTSPDQTAETRNEINTRILAAPGDVAVLAGLYRQTTSDQVDGIPGLTGNSVAAGLLGGASSTSKVRSELLVFIAPTVLEPGA